MFFKNIGRKETLKMGTQTPRQGKARQGEENFCSDCQRHLSKLGAPPQKKYMFQIKSDAGKSGTSFLGPVQPRSVKFHFKTLQDKAQKNKYSIFFHSIFEKRLNPYHNILLLRPLLFWECLITHCARPAPQPVTLLHSLLCSYWVRSQGEC